MRLLHRIPRLAALVLVLSGPAAAQERQDASDPDSGAGQAGGAPLTFLDSVTVTATQRPAPVRETPGMVTVIDDAAIQGRLFENLADLVKYEPGVYVANNLTRLGLNGFNIRGIGRNRVMTQVDGVQTSEQFDFGPFNVHQSGIDVDALKSVEIVRSANSALYGSDALGGVVSLFTKDPADYLRGRRLHAGAKITWDGRARDTSGNFVLAGGNERIQGSLFASVRRGGEIRNQGTVETADGARTAPNPQDVAGMQALAKAVFTAAPGNVWRMTAEAYDARVETDWLSDRGRTDLGFISYVTTDSSAVDTQDRRRLSLDHALAGRGLDLLTWQVYGQFNDTSQVVDRERLTFAFGPPTPSLRHGTVDYEQVGYGGAAQGQQQLGSPDGGALLTFGASFKTDRFDIVRDRTETHARTGAPVPTSLIFPTKYFPRSDVAETGAYVQAELRFGRFTLVPGVRYDHFRLDADQADPIFLASLNPAPADFSDGAVSPRIGAAVRLTDVVTVHAQYAGGFRAPPYSDVNSGFSNPQGGYVTLPNPDLRAETSDNFEAGVRTTFDRASLDLTLFTNRYDGFIELTDVGFNPRTRLLEFQSRNLDQARINGFELRAEGRLGDDVTVRGSYARNDGTEIAQGAAAAPLAAETPLGSVAPNEGVIGVRYVRPTGRWGGELSVRLVEAYAHGDAEQYAPEAHQVVDAVGFVSLAEALTLRLGLLNLTDARYFEWWNVRGRGADDPVIDRYSSPGVSFVGSLGYDW